MKNVTIIIIDDSENHESESEESSPGEDWMYNDDINSGMY